MQAPNLPTNENERMFALQQSGLLDSCAEERFDRLTRLVQQCLNTEVALISLVDKNRQWFKSKQGLSACETGRDISFCGHTILGQDIFEVQDTLEDPRFADNPLVTGPPNIRFYAGAPLFIENAPIGTLCIIDSQPRTLTPSERDILRQFADAVQQEIYDRLQEQAHDLLANRELRYRSVLEGTRTGTWEWNVQSGETTFNDRWAEIVGYTLDELAPISIDTWINLAHPEDLKDSGECLDQHFEGQSAFYDVKCRMRHKLGHWVWVHARGRVVSWTSDSKPLMMYGTHTDITEQKLAEEQLKDSRDQFEALVNNIPGITYRCLADEHWTMLYMSGSIDPLSGYPASDFINNSVRTYASVIHPDDIAYITKKVDEAVREKQSWLLNYRIVHKDSTIRFVEERGHAEYNENGSLRFLDGFILDITNEEKLKRQLVKLTEQIPGVVYQFQQWPDGRSSFPYASSNLKQIYGVTPDQVREDATPAFQTILTEDLPGVTASIEQSKKELSLWQHEYRVRNDNGDIAWLSGSATPELLPDKSILWHGYIYDITTTKERYLALEHANSALELAQKRLDLSSEQAQIGYWQASLKNGDLWWSPMVFEIFGFDEATTTPSVALFKSTLHPDDRHLVEASEERAKHTGLHDVVHRIVRHDGQIGWVHEQAQMLPESDNPDLIMIGSVQDVTERMRLQHMKDEFISTVSHELRTPLTSINGALKILQSTQASNLGEKERTLLDIANSNSDRLLRLINDLLDIEKLVAGKMTFHLEACHATPLIEQALSDHTTYAEKAQLKLTLDASDDARQSKISIDEHRFQQILANLLSNAIKYSPPGGEVLVQVQRRHTDLEIAVQDQGPGIPKAYENKLFQRFTQADGSDTKTKGGTGLGLALCKELVEGMQGTIDFEESRDSGARLYVCFPITGET